jgi:hypothetical protein
VAGSTPPVSSEIASATTTERTRKIDSGTSGAAARRSTSTKRIKARTAAANRPMVRGVVQPCS